TRGPASPARRPHRRHPVPPCAPGAGPVHGKLVPTLAVGGGRHVQDLCRLRPTGDGEDTLTLSRTVDVAGELTPVTDRPLSAKDEVDGFEVTLGGDLTAGTSSDLTLSVTQDGVPVTALEPDLGAFGHLVALREGDMEYLHVHAEGEDAAAGETSGPEVSFMAEA